MATTPEGKLLKRAIAWAAANGIPTIRLSFARGVATGWPDVLMLVPGGRPLLMEFKAPKGVLSPMQKHRLKTLTELGYDVAVVYSFDQASASIASALQRASSCLPKTRRRAPDA